MVAAVTLPFSSIVTSIKPLKAERRSTVLGGSQRGIGCVMTTGGVNPNAPSGAEAAGGVSMIVAVCVAATSDERAGAASTGLGAAAGALAIALLKSRNPLTTVRMSASCATFFKSGSSSSLSTSSNCDKACGSFFSNNALAL